MAKTITFFGASGGCGYYALKAALADGHVCVCLLRVPSKLADLATAYPSQLLIVEGNAHNVDDVTSTLVNPMDPTRLVDAVCTSIGNKPPDMAAMVKGMTAGAGAEAAPRDPEVCQKGATVLLEALSRLRAQDPSRYGTAAGESGPLIAVVSTTGIRAKRDYPLAFWPLYEFMLAQPHADKKVMEEVFRNSSESYALVRPSLLWDDDDAKVERKKAEGKFKDQEIRVGVADARTGTVEREEIGYLITRQAVWGWLYQEVLMGERVRVEGKAFSITH